MMAASAARLSLPPLARLLSPLLALALLAAVPARGDLEVQLGMIEKKCFRFACLSLRRCAARKAAAADVAPRSRAQRRLAAWRAARGHLLCEPQ